MFMIARNKLFNQVLQLPQVEKARLIELVHDSMDKPDPAVEKVWAKESDRRFKAYKAGRVKGIPAEKIFGKFK